MHVHDHLRPERIGIPEAVLCSPKTTRHLDHIIRDLAERGTPNLLTRLTPEAFEALAAENRELLTYDPVSETATLNGKVASGPAGHVAIVAAGTSDEQVAAEAAATLDFCAVDHELIVDVGVAGLWRLEQRLPDIRRADVVIAVAGMDAAIVSVLGGLVASPVVAVPTSVGYGVAEGGHGALTSALSSCAQGIPVMNIDNGFGAACAVVRILNMGAQLATGNRND